jgi:DNA-directed RNA polymerase subunit RPC12/RpoP
MAAREEEEIAQAALDIAQALQNNAARLREEYLVAEAHAASLKAEYDTARAAPKRLANFQVKIRTDYQCPRCWIENERRSALLPVPSDAHDELMKCRTCHYEIRICY